MSTPTINETISVVDPLAVTGSVQLYAQDGGGGVAYTNAGTQITLGGVVEVSFNASGQLKAADGTSALTLNPNSGSSDDAIASPSGTVWQYRLRYPGVSQPVVRYLSVPDTAGPYNVADILDVNPTDFPLTGAVPAGGATGSVLTKQSATDRDADWEATLDLTTDLDPATTLAGTDEVVAIQSSALVAATLTQISACAAGLIKNSDLLASTTALSWAQNLTLNPSSGTGLIVATNAAVNGSVSVTGSIFGPLITLKLNSADTVGALTLVANGFSLGAGGSSATDTSVVRSGTAALSVTGQTTFVTGITLSAVNIVTDTTTGMKIGTATSQKIGMYNVTPVIQYATTGTSTGFTAGGGTAVTHTSTFTGGLGSTAYTIGDIVLCLKRLGPMAQ